MRSWTQSNLKKKKHQPHLPHQSHKVQGRAENSNFSPNTTVSSFLFEQVGHKVCHQQHAHTGGTGERNTFVFLTSLLKSSPRHACLQFHISLSDKLSSKPAHPNSTLHLSRKKSSFLHVAKTPSSSGEADMFLTIFYIILQIYYLPAVNTAG